MNLSDLRTSTLMHLDDPAGDTFARGSDGSVDNTRIDDLINSAYFDLVDEVEQVADLWNLADDTVTVTVALADGESTIAREWPLVPESNAIRTIHKIRRTDTDPAVELLIRPREERDREITATPYERFSDDSRVIGAAGRSRERVYVFRKSTAAWSMGFFNTEPVAQTLGVEYIPVPVVLDQDNHIPIMVPTQWHRLIALLAAVYGKGQVSRDVRTVQGLYAIGLARMQQDISSLVRRGAVAI